ncbi:MAG: DeoR/GlpR transcriptional regulator [Caldilineaceae bacterium]|nr:DeoR/GlpR transcriptional regulator [Caldilineaceae bacterium]
MSSLPILYAEERRQSILELVNRSGRVAVGDLSKRFGVSSVTIRTDLQTLAEQNLLVRTHGGAVSTGPAAAEMAIALRRERKVREKQRIGRAGAALAANGDAVYLDSSSTSLAIARFLKSRRLLTVITNSLMIVQELLDAPHIQVMLTGGSFQRETAAFVGPYTHAFLDQVHIQIGFFGAHGIAAEPGLTDISPEIAAAKRPVLKRCRQAVAVVDASKWGRVGIAPFAGIDEMDIIITDDSAPADAVRAVEAMGADVRFV